MKKLSKEELVKQIKTIFDTAQDQINKLIKDNDFIYSGNQTIEEIKELKEDHGWLTASFDKFFKHFNSITHCPNLTLMTMANIRVDEVSSYSSRKLDDYLMSSEEKQAFIDGFEKSNQDRIKKQKKIDKLLKKIEDEQKKLDKMKDEYYELTDGKQYHI